MHPASVPAVRVEDLPDPVPDDLTLLDVREPLGPVPLGEEIEPGLRVVRCAQLSRRTSGSGR